MFLHAFKLLWGIGYIKSYYTQGVSFMKRSSVCKIYVSSIVQILHKIVSIFLIELLMPGHKRQCSTSSGGLMMETLGIPISYMHSNVRNTKHVYCQVLYLRDQRSVPCKPDLPVFIREMILIRYTVVTTMQWFEDVGECGTQKDHLQKPNAQEYKIQWLFSKLRRITFLRMFSLLSLKFFF